MNFIEAKVFYGILCCMSTPKLFTKNMAAFNEQLQRIDIDSLPIAGYSKRYLQHLILNSRYFIEIYQHVLSNAKCKATQQPGELNLVDFGSGNGLLGLFSKFCGFKKVFLCDMDPDFVFASESLAAAMNITIDGFICGDAEEMAKRLQHEKIDLVIGTDVIEHIYSLGHFFACIKSMNPNMITVFTTASNPDNLVKVRRLQKLQINDELEGSDPANFVLAGAEKQNAFLDERRKIISTQFPGIWEKDLQLISKLTRGLAAADIVNAAEHFLATNELPVPLVHPTNTCDPHTGSWTERILSIKEYRDIYARHGFTLSMQNGFYNPYATGAARIRNTILNLAVKLLGKNLAPFITLTGYKAG